MYYYSGMQLIELAIKRASAANLASPSLKIRPLIQRVFNRIFRDAGFLLFEGRDSGFRSEKGSRFGIENMLGTRDNHRDYGIAGKYRSE